MRDRSTKMMAVLMVSLMAVVALAPLAGEETDAAVGDGGTYSYTLTYNSAQMSNTAAQETQLTVADMTPISHASGTNTLSALANVGSWEWNTTTGIGPFNSFYAAFDATNGNSFVSILDPYDLSKKINGVALDDITKYNIMWVLPTVYWSVDNSGNVTLTNDSTAGGTAYAHTIDSHVYNYIAYGVYEGSTITDGSTTLLVSKSGANPVVSKDKSAFRTYASNYVMDSTLGTNADSMLWNWYQWQLYRLCSFTVMEGFDSQSIVGSGWTENSTIVHATGTLDDYGPYAGSPGGYANNAVKLFIENAWGGASEYIDGIYLYNGKYYVQSSSNPNDTYPNGTMLDYVQPAKMFADSISTDATSWGMAASNTSGSTSIGLTDFQATTSATSTASALIVGGMVASMNSFSVSGPGYGISYIYNGAPSNPYGVGENYISSRLMFVMDEYIPSYDVTIVSNNNAYGTVNVSEIPGVLTGSEISISTNTLSIGSTTVTATPAANTSEYEYSFTGWFNGSTQLVGGETVTGDMTITAKFSRAAILTVTLDAGKGTVSSSSMTVVEGQPIGDLPTPTPKAGYTFTGWFDSEGNEVTSETIVTETESFTLYAQYELDDSLKPVKAMTDLLPLIFVVGIIILMIGTAFYYYRP